MTWAQAEPREGSWREQRRMRARGAIDLHEIARPAILDAGRVEGNHLRTEVRFWFAREQHGKSRIVNRVRGALPSPNLLMTDCGL
jgi:hypothetical protein